MDKALLSLTDIHTSYGECPVLKGVSLEIQRGSTIALLGRNGMGKTTTIRSIIGFNPPEKGSVKFKDVEISGMSANKIARLGIGLVPQGRRIFRSLTVKENLLVAAQGQTRTDAWNLDAVYELFPVLKKRAGVVGTSLSGGEQQMLAIARALLTNPDLILLDEPSEGLAPIIVKKLASFVNKIKSHGTSILVVEQNLEFSLTTADHIYIISSGRIVADMSPEELENDENTKTKHLGVGC